MCRPCRYIVIVYNISITLALIALLLFYVATKDLLAPHRPVLKFVVVKSVIFLSFWQVRAWVCERKSGGYMKPLSFPPLPSVAQPPPLIFRPLPTAPHSRSAPVTSDWCGLCPLQGVVLALAEVSGVIGAQQDISAGEVATSYQNFLICIEMFLAAVMHTFAFAYAPYKPEGGHRAARASIKSIYANLNSVRRGLQHPPPPPPQQQQHRGQWHEGHAVCGPPVRRAAVCGPLRAHAFVPWRTSAPMHRIISSRQP